MLQEGRDRVRRYPDTGIVLTDKRAAVLQRKSAVRNGRFDDPQGRDCHDYICILNGVYLHKIIQDVTGHRSYKCGGPIGEHIRYACSNRVLFGDKFTITDMSDDSTVMWLWIASQKVLGADPLPDGKTGKF